MLFIRLIAVILFAFASLAKDVPVHVVLDSADSKNLFDAMKGVDSWEWFESHHHSMPAQVRRDIKKFQTQDGSVVIRCTAESMLGTMMNHTCDIAFDRLKVRGDNLIEEKAPGLFYGFINSRADAIALYERFLKPVTSFQSFEKLPVKNIDGSYANWFRFFAQCSFENDGPYLRIPRACTLSGISN